MSAYTVKPPQELEVCFGKGLVGTIAIPHAVDNDDAFAEEHAPGTHKIALILHGQGGHRDYCYQKQLAHKLASTLGIYSLRIDFRGCGSSADNEDDTVGRVISQDIEDIQACANFITKAENNPLGIAFTLLSIISHSRGAVAMFLWALKQDAAIKAGGIAAAKAIVVPNLVNCLSRFSSHTVLGRYEQIAALDSVSMTSLRHGKMQPVKIPRDEILSLSTPDLTLLSGLSRDWSVLSVYGLKDTIIPVDDFANFANVLNRGPGSHLLKVIPEADHNFFGVEKVDDPEDDNPLGLPLNKRGLVNYNYQVVDIICDYLSPANELRRFVDASVQVGKLPRWKYVEGVNNFRDAGGWHINLPRFTISSEPAQYFVKPNTIFRCANMATMTPKGAHQLARLGVKTIFDLRSDGECEADGVASHLEGLGIKRIHAPLFKKDDYSPQSIAVRYSNLMTSWHTYVHVYEDMLENGEDAFRTIFRYIRDDGAPFVFHCTAGKDRTGLVSMLILLLAGVDKSLVSKEYELTTLGLRKEHPVLRGKFLATVGKLREKMGGESSQLEEMIGRGRKNFRVEVDGFNNLISSRYEAMLATIELFNEKYGGVERYFTERLGFTHDDIVTIFKKLVVIGEDFDSQNLVFDHRFKARF